ncbi:MAG: LysR substrate-binding domain-containing protein [Pseudomonadota bacterium]
MDLDLKSVKLFVRVAALGAIGRAGAEFGLSATAATQRIRALEGVVGAQLLHRTTRAVSLSADGEVFLAHAKRIIADVEDAFADMQGNPETIQGELRIASSASFGRKLIAPFVHEFLATYPSVSIQLDMSDGVVDIVEQGFDLAIRLGELAPSTLKARALAESPRMVVASPGYIERHGRPESLGALKQHNCLARADIRTWRFRGPGGDTIEARIAGNFATNLAEGITEAALSGLGVARKCRWEIAEHLEAGTLVPLLEDHTVLPEWRIFAVRSPAPQTPPRVRAFTDFLAAKLKNVPALAPKEVAPPERSEPAT